MREIYGARNARKQASLFFFFSGRLANCKSTVLTELAFRRCKISLLIFKAAAAEAAGERTSKVHTHIRERERARGGGWEMINLLICCRVLRPAPSHTLRICGCCFNMRKLHTYTFICMQQPAAGESSLWRFAAVWVTHQGVQIATSKWKGKLISPVTLRH